MGSKTTNNLKDFTIPAVDPNGVVGTHPGVVLTDGVDVWARFEGKMPELMRNLNRAYLVIVPGGTGNLRRSVNSNYGVQGEAYNVHAGAIAAGQVAVIINQITFIDVTAVLANVGAGDHFGLEFIREASNALDTANADCRLLSLNVQYV